MKEKEIRERPANLKTRPPSLYSARRKKKGGQQQECLTKPKQFTSAEWSRIREEQLAMSFMGDVQAGPTEPRPFLKWAGGKSAVLPQIARFFPANIDRYIEPFLGGGAVFFFLKHKFPGLRAFLRDSNKELINCYRIVRDRPIELMRWLDHHVAQFKKHGATYFYTVRAEHDLADDLARAARTIFLNKTCFNGLHRVNAKGEFNTPVGSSPNPGLYDRRNLLACSAALREAQLEASDFRVLPSEARKGDVIYLDPPYVAVSEYSDFERYTADQLQDAEQAEFARVFQEFDAEGCHLILSVVEDPAARKLRSGFDIEEVLAPCFIACVSNN